MKAARRRSQPWHEKQLELISACVIAGATIRQASAAAGVKWSTVRHWLNKGHRGIDPYTRFTKMITEAKAMRKVVARLMIMQAAQRGEWRAAAWMLEKDLLAEALAEEQRLLHHPEELEPEERAVVLLYPVPMPDGADPSQFRLCPGTQDAPDVARSEETPVH